jgi:hypothetical protein
MRSFDCETEKETSILLKNLLLKVSQKRGFVRWTERHMRAALQKSGRIA